MLINSRTLVKKLQNGLNRKTCLFPKKQKCAFFGNKNPKPINKISPSQPYETIHIQSKELLETWLIKQENHKGIVLLFHGYSGSKADNIGYGQEFNKLGYSTLLVDFMGTGGSTGNQTNYRIQGKS